MRRLFSLIIVGLFFVIIAIVVNTQTNFLGYLNLGTTFEVFSDKNTLTNFDKGLDYIYNAQYLDEQKIEKWSKPLKIKYIGSPTEKDIETLNKIIERFNTIDGFPGMSLVDADENIKVIYTTSENHKAIKTQYNGGSFESFCSRSARNGEIIAADIIIEPGGLQGYRNSVVLHEFFHMVGFSNHTTDIKSILNTIGPVSSLSEVDLLSFKMLYNPNIKIGMTYEQLENYYKNIEFNDFNK